jgi:hypothetical protein
MKRTFIKRIVIGTAATLLLLVAVLGIHIYIVTKPKADAKTVAMARIDIKQSINETEAGSIEKWLAEQTGVQHVALNRESNILVFTFYPIKVSANQLADNLKATFNINAERFRPSAEQMASGCPAMSHTLSGKVYSFFTHIFNHN